MANNWWMVRAGEGGRVVDEFENQSCVAISWGLPDLTHASDRDQIREIVLRQFPAKRPRQIANAAAQVSSFLFDLNVGDRVLTYNPETRTYLIGEITGAYEFSPGKVKDHDHCRTVVWTRKVSRDDLSVAARNSLGPALTVFRPSQNVWDELEGLFHDEVVRPPSNAEVASGLEELLDDLEERAREMIKDTVLELDWEQMQNLVAGALEAMGYKTFVSPRGADRGKDIVASPDGLGLEQPRIRVEVKHRPRQTMGAPEIRGFIGGLRPGDNGLYVSTGGFTREGHYEAERANVPLTLIDLDTLVHLVVSHYEKMTVETRALLPLARVYWPISAG